MSGIIFLIVLIAWFFAACWLAMQIANRIAKIWKEQLALFVLMPLIFISPIADELVGRWQFSQVCKANDIVHIGPEANTVKRAKSVDLSSVELDWKWIPMKETMTQYIDLDTGQVFLSYKSIQKDWGYLLKALDGLGAIPSDCRPKEWWLIPKKIGLQYSDDLKIYVRINPNIKEQK
jgi:hypothetical protein